MGSKTPSQLFNSCVNLSIDESFDLAIECMEIFKSKFPHTKLAQEAELHIGDAHFERKDYDFAIESYLFFLKQYPYHQKADYAHYRIGTAYLKKSPKSIARDQSMLPNALDHLRIITRMYPNSSYIGLALNSLHETKKRIAKRNHYIGRFYIRTGQLKAAIPRLKTVAYEHHDSGLAPKALFLLVQCHIKLNQLNAAKDAFSILESRYPDTKEHSGAEKKLLKVATQQAKKQK